MGSHHHATTQARIVAGDPGGRVQLVDEVGIEPDGGASINDHTARGVDARWQGKVDQVVGFDQAVGASEIDGEDLVGRVLVGLGYAQAEVNRRRNGKGHSYLVNGQQPTIHRWLCGGVAGLWHTYGRGIFQDVEVTWINSWIN
jgi:hypothetical protein